MNKRWWVLALGAAALAVAVAVAALALRGPQVDTLVLQSAPLVRSLQFSARVATLSRVDLGSTVTGRVAQVRVAAGAQVRRGELEQVDYLVAMDYENLVDLRRLSNGTAHAQRLMDFAGPGYPADVPDPYYTGEFEYVYELVEAGCKGLLESIKAGNSSALKLMGSE